MKKEQLIERNELIRKCEKQRVCVCEAQRVKDWEKKLKSSGDLELLYQTNHRLHQWSNSVKGLGGGGAGSPRWIDSWCTVASQMYYQCCQCASPAWILTRFILHWVPTLLYKNCMSFSSQIQSWIGSWHLKSFVFTWNPTCGAECSLASWWL